MAAAGTKASSESAPIAWGTAGWLGCSLTDAVASGALFGGWGDAAADVASGALLGGWGSAADAVPVWRRLPAQEATCCCQCAHFMTVNIAASQQLSSS